MPKYLVAYHGGEPQSSEARQQIMQAFGAWAASVGESMIDPGAPLVAMVTVSREAVVDGPAEGPVGATRCSTQAIWLPPSSSSKTTHL